MKIKLILTTGIIFLIASYSLFKGDHVPFDQGVWLSSKHCKPIKIASQRFTMIEDLTTNILKNKTAEEIRNLLGEPEELKVLPHIKRDFLYCIGKAYGLTLRWMVIHLDGEGIFDRYEIVGAD